MTTFKHGSVLVSGAGGDPRPGFTIEVAATAPIAQQALMVADYINAPIKTWPPAPGGGAMCFGDYFTAIPNVGSAAQVGFDASGPTPARNPAAVLLPDGDGQGIRWWAGSGAPSTSTIGGTAQPGDRYTREDTPETAGQREYRCTVAGWPGTWAAVL